MAAPIQKFIPENQPQDTAMTRARLRLSTLAGVKIKNVMDEVRLTQEGISVSVYDSIRQLGASPAELAWVIKPRTLTHRKNKKEPLTQEESGRWLRAAKTQALAIEVFGCTDKALTWLHKPRKRFGNQSAAELIQTEAGAQLVEETLNQIDSGYFA